VTLGGSLETKAAGAGAAGPGAAGAAAQQSAEGGLAELGYAQQLLREMGGFHNFALSFSIISILTGAVTLYGQGLVNGGPLVMLLGWPLVTLLTLPVAASLAQLASSFPTAGALYHWSSLLGGRGLGFFTAWLNTLGQFAVTAGIDYGLAGFLADLFGVADPTAELQPFLDHPGAPAAHQLVLLAQLAHRRHVVLALHAALLASHALLNHLGVRLVSRLNALSAWVHIAGVALIVGALALFAPHQPLPMLLQRHQPAPGPYLPVFLLGLLQASWTFTGYDASAHACEETQDPTRNAPWGIFLSVAVSGVVGWALLIGVTLSIPDLGAAVAASNPFIAALEGALGGVPGRALVWVAMLAMWFCGLASITSNSRMLWAFARDGGLPFSAPLARVSPRFATPHVAIWASAAAAFLLAVWADAYTVVTALSTVALYASYGLPIAAGLWARKAGLWTRRGPWDLGRHSAWINLLALAWIAAAVVLFVIPPNELAGYTFGGTLLFLCAYWFGYLRKRFAGPPGAR
jgi:amino acid transporter